ncbi:tRNA U38,U39,U40 pseudouridine synthase TruA [Paenibacillus jamilae]|nr:tRNA U38,U39,U40 pseudouridine synthase TruA [Paenibacillus jamilae]
MKKMDVSDELAEILINCFICDIDTEQEKKLHEDGYVKKKLKQYLGKKNFDKYDELKEQIWKDAWREFDKVASNKNT